MLGQVLCVIRRAGGKIVVEGQRRPADLDLVFRLEPVRTVDQLPVDPRAVLAAVVEQQPLPAVVRDLAVSTAAELVMQDHQIGRIATNRGDRRGTEHVLTIKTRRSCDQVGSGNR